MNRIIKLLALSALVLAASSCSKSLAEQMKLAENVKITCTPEVLEAVAGQIPVEISVSYPEKYFQKLATMEVTPVLVYDGKEQAGPTFKYQGEKVKDNNKVVAYNGGTVKESLKFKYEDGCQKSHLELRSVAYFKGRTIEIPAVKVADGCITTYMLADLGVTSPKDDGYQAVIKNSAEGRILYDVNSANVKKSELASASVKDFQEALKEIEADERTTVTGTQIVAYASPEGGKKLNAELSDKRANSAQKVWSKVTDGMKADDVKVQSVGQDWDGFQEAVSKSDIQDKDLILRVLSMYSDPAVRESEIRNMSQIYTEINKKVFPALRRARFIADTEFKNYTDDELLEMAKKSLDDLDEPSVLHIASLMPKDEDKIAMYKYAINEFGSDIARYNLADIYLHQDNASLAGAYLTKIKAADADVMNATGVVALRNADYAQAARCFANAGTPEAKENLGVIDIYNGNYKEAASKLSGITGPNAAIANILSGDLNAASKALVDNDPKSDYLRAIIAARKGDVTGAKKFLSEATSKCQCLKDRAATDIEFAAVR